MVRVRSDALHVKRELAPAVKTAAKPFLARKLPPPSRRLAFFVSDRLTRMSSILKSYTGISGLM